MNIQGNQRTKTIIDLRSEFDRLKQKMSDAKDKIKETTPRLTKLDRGIRILEQEISIIKKEIATLSLSPDFYEKDIDYLGDRFLKGKQTVVRRGRKVVLDENRYVQMNEEFLIQIKTSKMRLANLQRILSSKLVELDDLKLLKSEADQIVNANAQDRKTTKVDLKLLKKKMKELRKNKNLTNGRVSSQSFQGNRNILPENPIRVNLRERCLMLQRINSSMTIRECKKIEASTKNFLNESVITRTKNRS